VCHFVHYKVPGNSRIVRLKWKTSHREQSDSSLKVTNNDSLVTRMFTLFSKSTFNNTKATCWSFKQHCDTTVDVLIVIKRLIWQSHKTNVLVRRMFTLAASLLNNNRTNMFLWHIRDVIKTHARQYLH
jgi:hypothetical protein